MERPSDVTRPGAGAAIRQVESGTGLGAESGAVRARSGNRETLGADDPADRWPAWFGLAGFVGALAITGVVITLLAGLAHALGVDLDPAPPEFVLVSTLAQDVALVGAAFVLASLTARPTAAQFGLRPLARGRLLASTALAAVTFAGATAVWTALVGDTGQQSVLDRLGTRESTSLLVSGAVLIIVVAPVTEELFFRGFFYRALRNRLPAWAAIVVVAAVFGAIHYDGGDSMPALPLLAALGALFCVLYEWTGSLYPAIALHTVNNTLAFAVDADAELAPPLAAVLGSLALGTYVALAQRPASRRS
jgi:membrane protease YdiL (CAAX protease family)